MIETIAILILFCVILAMAVYATATMLRLIFKGTLTLAPRYLKVVAWFFVVSGSVFSVWSLWNIIVILLPIV